MRVEKSKRKKAHAAEVPDIVKQIIQATTTEQGHEILNEVVKIITLNEKDNEKNQ